MVLGRSVCVCVCFFLLFFVFFQAKINTKRVLSFMKGENLRVMSHAGGRGQQSDVRALHIKVHEFFLNECPCLCVAFRKPPLLILLDLKKKQKTKKPSRNTCLASSWVN